MSLKSVFESSDPWEGFINGNGRDITPKTTTINARLRRILSEVLDDEQEQKPKESNKKEDNFEELISNEFDEFDDRIFDDFDEEALTECLSKIENKDQTPPKEEPSEPPKTPKPSAKFSKKKILYKSTTTPTQQSPNRFSTPSPSNAKVSPVRTKASTTPSLKGTPLKSILQKDTKFKSPLSSKNYTGFKSPSKVRKIIYSSPENNSSNNSKTEENETQANSKSSNVVNNESEQIENKI